MISIGSPAAASMLVQPRTSPYRYRRAHTPADVHFRLAAAKTADRQAVLAQARARHPHRFGAITTAPKMLDLPNTVWINQLADTTSQETRTDAA